MSQKVGALLLAAGFSKRFGSTKLLARLGNGELVIAQTYRRLVAALDQVMLVTRPELEAELTQQVTAPLIFTEADRGMGATLAFGINEAAQAGWDACLICLGDMPFIRTDTYTQLVAAATPNQIFAPTYQRKIGNPIVFGSRFFPELIQVSGDAGGKPIIRRHQDKVVEVEVPDPAILADIDTQDDLEKLQQTLA